MLLRTTRFALAVVAVAALSACPEPVPSADAGPPPTDAGADAGFDAGALPIELTFSLRAGLADGGNAVLQLQPGTRPLIDPPIELELVVHPQLKNYRVRVFDEADKIVESDDQADDSRPGQLDYRIRFLTPLQTGRRYSLVFDAQTGEALVDSAGVKHPDQRLEFQIVGEKQRPQSPKASKKKKKR
ncbi:MAG: hypothetical protein ACYC8T_01375 [Myxococcaceae bacterium]